MRGDAGGERGTQTRQPNSQRAGSAGDGNVHGENGGAAANVKNNLVLEDVLVLHNSVHVRSRAHLIFLPRAKLVSGVRSPCAGLRGGEGIAIPTSPRGCLLPCKKTKVSSRLFLFPFLDEGTRIFSYRGDHSYARKLSAFWAAQGKTRLQANQKPLPLKVMLLAVFHGLELLLGHLDLHLVAAHFC